jgi:hypothetical protein
MTKQNINKNVENETTEFNWQTMHDLYDNGPLKEHIDCKNYISKYFIPTTIGTHIHLEHGKPTILQDVTMKAVYLKRFKKDISKWFLEETIPKRLICDISKPMMGDTFINISSQLKHEYKEYKSFNKKTQASVDIMLDYIKLIWADSNEEVFTYLIKWFANMVKGNKNSSYIYAKGAEGIGKSTLVDFITEFVIGVDMTCKGKSDHLKGQHNMQLLGKLFVVFEELQLFSDKEWRAVDSELKDLITGAYASYTDKYEKRFDAQNNNNYIVNTNHGAIKSANGRRYFVADISPDKMNDVEYFSTIRNSCFNNKVGHAFYCYLVEIDTKEFNALIIPMTQAKKDLCADLITPLEKFLKFEHLLKNIPLKGKVKTYFEDFGMYCASNNHYQFTTIQKFSQSMRELGLTYKLLNGYNGYNVSIENLKVLANKKKWLHDLDEVEDDKKESDPIKITKFTNMKEFYENKEQEYEARIAELEKKLNEKSKKKIKKIKKEPKPESEDEGNDSDDEITLYKDINFF